MIVKFTAVSLHQAGIETISIHNPTDGTTHRLAHAVLANYGFDTDVNRVVDYRTVRLGRYLSVRTVYTMKLGDGHLCKVRHETIKCIAETIATDVARRHMQTINYRNAGQPDPDVKLDSDTAQFVAIKQLVLPFPFIVYHRTLRTSQCFAAHTTIGDAINALKQRKIYFQNIEDLGLFDLDSERKVIVGIRQVISYDAGYTYQGGSCV